MNVQVDMTELWLDFFLRDEELNVISERIYLTLSSIVKSKRDIFFDRTNLIESGKTELMHNIDLSIV